ncbi:S1 family peptidase [Actinomadura rubrisoli]|uniref:S1 family peptidase n=1 Tax=Actinomadura rubrisoli TaxID=2530368 RepID=A0A4R5BYK1_9ACTN|nr:S1 family peptidase [Actinomadura rubrisoli]TDD90500.1 S1 family peptidase [Actinomadura rubrisoli]
MARRHLLLGITAGTGLVLALAAPVQSAGAATPAHRPQAAPAAPAPDGDQAARVQKRLRLSLGAKFGGAWVKGGKQIVVATTDASTAKTIRAAGAEPKIVKYAERTLDAVQAGLNRHSRSAAKSVTSWYVDTDSNTVVVNASDTAAAKRFVAASGVDAAAVKIVKSAEKPRLVHDIVGGERYWTTQYGCSVAFSVTNGFITAGHCGKKGEQTKGSNQVAQGSFGGSSFPGDDYAWVDTNDQWTPTPKVTKWNGSYETVRGATDAAVGTTACRSGGTTNTQIWCGPIQQRNATVRYAEGTVTGLIRANICADPGDSGGALITQTGGQAQGITSGTSGTCKNGQGSDDQTYFQPVDEVLRLIAPRQLITEGGGPDPGEACDGYQTKAAGSLTSGSEAYQPNGNYTTTASGAHTACLDGPDGVDFDLYLQKLNGSTWTNVASSTSPDPDEKISYNGAAGTYRYRVHSYDGSGDYTLGFSKP